MNIRWLWLNHIPPEMELTEAERADVRRMAHAKRLKEPRFRKSHRINARVLVMTLIPLALSFVVWVFVLPRLRLGTVWMVVSNVTGILLFNALLWSCICWAWYRTNAPYVRWALWQIGKPVCVGCGYILTGAEDPTRPCPECGEQPETLPVNQPEFTR